MYFKALICSHFIILSLQVVLIVPLIWCVKPPLQFYDQQPLHIKDLGQKKTQAVVSKSNIDRS